MKKRVIKYLALSSVALGFTSYSSNEVMASTVSVSRIEGENRFQTASNISQTTYDTADTVVIVNARGFADALAGAPLAYQLEAPILLSQGNRLHSSTIKEIERLGAENAVILGGEAAVSASISNELQNLGLNIDRIAGDNRFETAEKIADSVGEFVSSDKAVVVDGFEFADAMSVAPFAAKEGMPIYLTRTNRLTNEETLNNFSETYIVGGENAVSPSVESRLNNPKRLAGANRYETNIKVLDYFGIDSDNLFISTGLDFVDALTGSILAAHNNSGVALVRHNVSSELETFINSQNYGLTIFGGEAVISRNLFDELENLLSQAPLPEDEEEPVEEDNESDEDEVDFVAPDVSYELVYDEENHRMDIVLTANDMTAGFQMYSFPNDSTSEEPVTTYTVSRSATYIIYLVDMEWNVTQLQVTVEMPAREGDPVVDPLLPESPDMEFQQRYLEDEHMMIIEAYAIPPRYEYSHMILPDGTVSEQWNEEFRVSQTGEYRFEVYDKAGNMTEQFEMVYMPDLPEEDPYEGQVPPQGAIEPASAEVMVIAESAEAMNYADARMHYDASNDNLRYHLSIDEYSLADDYGITNDVGARGLFLNQQDDLVAAMEAAGYSYRASSLMVDVTEYGGTLIVIFSPTPN